MVSILTGSNINSGYKEHQIVKRAIVKILFVLGVFGLQLQIAHGATLEELRQQAQHWHQKFQKPSEGISLGEISKSERVYASAGKESKNGDAVDEHSLYEVGSITKVFTGILLADAVLQGKAELTDSIAKHLPKGVISADSPLQQVTLLQLSTHTSGLPRLPSDLSNGASDKDPYAHYSREHLFRYLSQFTQEDFESPGEFSYSNLGVGLLGEILAIINDTSYEELIDSRILKPLNMTSTWVQKSASSQPEHLKGRMTKGHFNGDETPYWRLNAFSGAGAMVSSVDDLLSFAEAHWSNDTPKYLQEAFALAMQSHTDTVGLGWFIDDKSFNHTGGTGGYRASLIINPAEKTAQVNLQNSSGEETEVVRKGDFSKIVGFWSGELDIGTQKLRLVLYVNDAGNATVYSIDQGGLPIPSSETTFENNKLTVKYPSIRGQYEATLKDGKLTGSWSQRNSIKLEMTHASEMPNTLKNVFNQVYQGNLEPIIGFWQGKIGNTKDGLFVYMEVSKVADTHEVTIWSPTQSPLPIAVTKVNFEENKLAVESKRVNGFFNATVNLDKKQIKGIWTQGDDSPLTLTWSSQRPK
ncbi:class A beta-lactamase-related serine hydrolase [Alteromonadaceae bacterium M269]|nr:class A beta-lactamase-related serine hydrolase [Alteromonadaceae bacterium M269]